MPERRSERSTEALTALSTLFGGSPARLVHIREHLEHMDAELARKIGTLADELEFELRADAWTTREWPALVETEETVVAAVAAFRCAACVTDALAAAPDVVRERFENAASAHAVPWPPGPA